MSDEDDLEPKPMEEALEDVQREFSPSFSPDTSSTSLIQREPNVLSKQSMLRMLRLQHRVDKRADMKERDWNRQRQRLIKERNQ